MSNMCFILSDTLDKCYMCGNETYKIDIFSESRMCSKECQARFDEDYWEAYERMVEEEIEYENLSENIVL